MIWQIEAIRGIASFVVVFAHSIIYAGTLGGLTGVEVPYLFKFFGAIGVDVFFVVSGFIISHAWHSNKKCAGDFLAGRFKRVYIPFFAIAVLSIGVISIKNYFGGPPLVASRIFVTILLIPYFQDNGHSLSYVGVSWTLIYEFIFYAVFSIGISLRRGSPEIISAIFIVLALCLMRAFDQSALFVSNLIQLEFVYGILIYMAIGRTSVILDNKVAGSFGWVVVLIVSIYIYEFDWRGFENKFEGDRAFVLGIWSMGFVMAVMSLNKWYGWVKFVCMKLGRVSYSLYLVHFSLVFPVVGFIWSRWLGPIALGSGLCVELIFAVLVSACIASSILFSLASYFFLENRLSNYIGNLIFNRAVIK
jgi:exopolysaccharide production protein ExoZ